jgi:hypothetical protein
VEALAVGLRKVADELGHSPATGCANAEAERRAAALAPDEAE